MKAAILTTVLTFAPAIVVAQQAGTPPTPPQNKPPVSAQAGVSAQTSASAQSATTAPSTYSAEGRAKIDAAFQAAKAKNLPDAPMRERIAEGQAKGATEAQVVEAVQGVQTRLEASQAALISGGRTQPDPNEIAAGAAAMERGASADQVAGLVKHAPAGRSLAVAFNVLAKLEANGEPVDGALAKVTAKLDAGATDDAVASLAGGLSGVLGGKKP
jgi:hypothetical protein